MTMRLNKFLAETLGLSRREADDLIASHKVILRGETAELGARLEPGDTLVVSGKSIDTATSAEYIYLAFHKPVGYVCSRRAQGDAPTIYDLLPKKYHALKTVGRLDKDSSGLILLTNDGDFAYKMTHPKFVKTKIYHVELDHALEPLHQQMIADFGIKLNDGTSQLGLSSLDNSRTRFEVTMTEGRNRQIRRTFAALGYTVTKLHRLAFGTYMLGNLKPGEYQKVKK